MRRIVWMGAGLMALAACNSSSEPVGENSAGSIRTTAVGNVVATEPSPTPTPDQPLAADNAVSAEADNMAASADAMVTNAAGN